MKSSEWTSPAHSGEGEIFSRLWAHEEPKAVLLLVHGMAEHSARYADFGSFLAQHGFAVFMNDHAGHGRSAVVQGHFADHDGWEHVLADLHRLETDARAKYPGLPVFIFGHSMGSFLTREYIARWGDGLAAAVICGTMGANPLLGFARALAGVLTAGTDGEQVHAILREGVVLPLVGSALEQGFALAALQQQGGGAFGHALGQYQFGAGGGNGLVQCLDGGAGAQIQLPPDHSAQNGQRPLVAHRFAQRLTGQGDGLFGQVFFGDVVIQKGEAASNNRSGEQNDHEQPQEQSFHPAASFSGSR